MRVKKIQFTDVIKKAVEHVKLAKGGNEKISTPHGTISHKPNRVGAQL